MGGYKRVQKVKGVPLPDGTIDVGPGTRWANPIIVGELVNIHSPNTDFPHVFHVTRASRAVKEFKHLVLEPQRHRLYSAGTYEPPTVRAIQRSLAGHDLACTCPPSPPRGVHCHADFLLHIANL